MSHAPTLSSVLGCLLGLSVALGCSSEPIASAPPDVALDLASLPDARIDVPADTAQDTPQDLRAEIPTGMDMTAEPPPTDTASDTAPDTAPTDTVPTDTAPTDTASADTAPADTVPADTAPVCMSPSVLCTGRCVDTRSDPAHCGACDALCARGFVCSMGRCELSCPASQTACDGACATLTTDANHCGLCTTRCPVGASCAMSLCACPTGQRACAGACIDTGSSRAHCGECGRTCAPARAVGACVEGSCRVLACDAGFGDCDGDVANGCETDTRSTAAHCAGCSRACVLARASVVCAASRCAVAACDPGFGDCDGDVANGCETDTRSTAAHCGGCGMTCRTGMCVAGVCLSAPSCLSLHTLSPSLGSGRYMLDPDGAGAEPPYEVYCDMTTDGGGWTYLATVTNQGDGIDRGSWLVATPTPNAWESTMASFGTLDPLMNADYRSAAFHRVTGRAIMVTHRGEFLLQSDASCLANSTLRAHFAARDWECRGSEAFGSHPPCTHACLIARSVPRVGDTALLNGAMRSRLYLKCGEADGAQDTNRDRSYLSTDYRSNVDFPVGLGAFCSGASCTPRVGEADVNTLSDAIVPAAGTEFYGLWIR